MKSTLTGSANTYQPSVYPCLKKTTDPRNGRCFVVMFRAPGIGTVVWNAEDNDPGYQVGEYRVSWCEDLFDLTGPDTIVNLHN